jgi:hypothetical protein
LEKPDWFAYTRSGKKPPDIPSHPERIYAKDGWAGWGDWLGTGTIGPLDYQFRPFKEARAFARGLRLKDEEEWFAYTRSGKKPADIPASPRRTYANDGWLGMGDWLDTGRVANQFRKYRPFKKARAFVHDLGLKSRAEWEAYCKSGKKPADIPAGPQQTYAKDGWAGWDDWLGTGRRRPGLGWRRFNGARAFVRSLGLKSRSQWHEYCQSGLKPADIPSNPNQVYATEGWRGMGDWLGTGTVATHLRQHRSFKKARALVRRLGLKSVSEWRDYCKSGEKPADIPAKPDSTYANDGWAGYYDWLGNGRVVRRSTSIQPGKQAVAEGVAF